MNHKDLWAKHIKLHIYTANSLKDLSRHNINFQIWRDRTIETLQKAFGINSDMVERFRKIKFSIPQKLHPDDHNNFDYAKEAYITGIEEAIRLLEECLQQLDDGIKLKLFEKTEMEVTTKGTKIDFNIRLSFEDLENHLKECNVPEHQQKVIMEELHEISSLLSKKQLDSEKIRLHKSKLAGLLNNVVVKTGAIAVLYHFLELFDTFLA